MTNVVIIGRRRARLPRLQHRLPRRPGTRVVAFTAAQIPGIDDRTYPAALAGTAVPARHPDRAGEELAELIAEHDVDEVVLAYSDLSHDEVMHKASLVLAAGADFRLLGPRATMLAARRSRSSRSRAVRTGSARARPAAASAQILARRRPARRARAAPDAVRRSRSDARASGSRRLADIDASHPTIEEREEYEAPVELGMVVFAGVDY